MSRKIKKNIEGKISSFTVILLLIVSILGSFLIIFPNNDISVRAETYGQFTYYKKITIESDQIPATQTNFPVLIKLSSDTDLANDALDSAWDIAFFSDDTNTQYHHEIEYFNGATGELVAWVNITSLAHDADTVIRMCYGDSDIGSHAQDITNTWHSMYDAVWHFNESSGNLLDSTSNNNDGVVTSATQGDTGVIDGDYSFDGGDDTVDVANTFNYGEDDFSVMVFCTKDSWGGTSGQDLINNLGAGAAEWFNIQESNTDVLRFRLDDGSSQFDAETASGGLVDGTYYLITGVRDSGTNTYLFLNGSMMDSTADTGWSLDTSVNLNIGSRTDSSSWWDGDIDECRIVSEVLDQNYIRTVYNNINNATTGFITLGGENPITEDTSDFGIIQSYLDSGLLKWSGQSDTTTYSNETVGAGNNLTWYVDVNISENCTDVYIDLSGDTAFGAGDEVDFDSGTGNSDMFLQVSTDGDWDSSDWLQFTDANSYNISLNTSWASICNDPEPFTINNASGNVTVTCIFRLDLGAGIAAGTYQTSANNVWDIIFKYETTW